MFDRVQAIWEDSRKSCAGSRISASAARADVEDFFRERAPRYAGGPRLLAQTLERIALCAAFKERQQASLSAFLRRQ